MEKEKVKVHTKDNKVLLIDKSDALEISYIRAQLEEAEETSKDIVLSEINLKELERVVEFVRFIQETPWRISFPTPLPSSNLSDLVEDNFDKYFKFVEIPKVELLMLIKAANYLNVERLFELACAKIGSQIKGMGIDDLRDFFDIKSDFTAEEEERVKNGKVNIYSFDDKSEEE